MATVTFKAKVNTVYCADGSVAYTGLSVPKITRNHCDMSAMRSHPKFRGYTNSDLFPNLLARAVAAKGIKNYIKMDAIPDGVTIGTKGFLAIVSFDL